MARLSVYIITKNGEKYIADVLKSVALFANEIIIVDSGSLDNTGEIVDDFRVKLQHKKPTIKYMYHDWKDYCTQKKFAESQCSGDWLLNLDDDEVLSPDLQQEIVSFLQSEKSSSTDGCLLKIGDMFPKYKKPRKWGRTYNIVRMYKKQSAKMSDNITEDRIKFVVSNPNLYQFHNFVYHYSFQGLSKLIAKENLFTDKVVGTMIRKKKHYSIIRLYTEFPVQFIKYYFLKRYIFNGYYGFISATVYAFFRFVRIAKYKEKIKPQN